MNNICQSKYEQESTEQEYHFLKKQIDYYQLPSQSFECSPIAQSTLIDSIEDLNIRKQLFQQYREVAVQFRATLFQSYLKLAKEEREEYRKKYDDNEREMHSNQNAPANRNEKLTKPMIDLINERCRKISERIQCVYIFKYQCFRRISQM